MDTYKKLDADMSNRRKVIGYQINSPLCGRDANGVFHCYCGKCVPLNLDVGEDGNNGGNDSGNG